MQKSPRKLLEIEFRVLCPNILWQPLSCFPLSRTHICGPCHTGQGGLSWTMCQPGILLWKMAREINLTVREGKKKSLRN